MKIFKIIISIILIILIFHCLHLNKIEAAGTFRQYMREFITDISTYSKNIKSDFLVITNNGEKLITINDNLNNPVEPYIKSIDGLLKEPLFYGDPVNKKTPIDKQNKTIPYLNLALSKELKIMVLDYCYRRKKVEHSYQLNNELDYINFAAENIELNNIPSYPTTPYNNNQKSINKLTEAKNFLYLINPGHFSSRSNFINRLSNTNYDILVIDLFFHKPQLTKKDLRKLKYKENNKNKRRLVLAYLSIGEAESYRYYWQKKWTHNLPEWIANENHHWEENYIVKYWKPAWQNIIYGSPDSYLDKIIGTGFDGVILDTVDSYRYFERKK